MSRRFLTAAVGLPIGILLLYLGDVWLTVGVFLLALAGLGEYFSATALKGLTPYKVVAYVSLLAFLLTAHFARGITAEALLGCLVVLFILISLAAPAFKGDTSWAIGNSATTLTAVLYVAFFFTFFVMLRNRPGTLNAFAPFNLNLPTGFVLLFYALAISWLTDTGAFFVGRSLGTQKLAPRVSPNKTLEGAVGGFIVALLVGALLGTWMGLPFRHAVILAFLGSIAGQVGDLAESAIKRDAGIKDFGHLFPGHGGVLDRFDSLLFNAPLFYFYVRLVGL